MKNDFSNQNCGPADGGSCFDWLDDRWFCGVPEGRCLYCGLPEIFPPECLGMQVCRCHAGISENETFAVEVRFSRVQTFQVKITEGKIPPLPSAGSSQFTFSGRNPFARNGNPCRRVLEASPRVHGDGHRIAMPRPAFLQPFNIDFHPANAPRRAGINTTRSTERQNK
jgi:hypothetical protein